MALFFCLFCILVLKLSTPQTQRTPMHTISLFYLLILFHFSYNHCSTPNPHHNQNKDTPRIGIHTYSTTTETPPTITASNLAKMHQELKAANVWCFCEKPYCGARIKMYYELLKRLNRSDNQKS